MSTRDGASGTSKEDPEADKKLLGKRKEALLGRLRRYLNHPDTKHDHIDALRDALLPKISYLSDIDTRLELAKSWCRSSHSAYCKYHRRDFEVVDKLAWASLMMAPMEAIRKFQDEECTDDGRPSQSDTCHLGESAIFLSRMIGELFPKRGYLPAHHYEPKDGLKAVEIKDHPRGDITQAISASSLRDDSTCVVTKSADPRVCLVLPFPISQTAAALEYILHKASGDVFGFEIRKYLALLQSPATVFSLANMISLNEILSKWWAKAWIALEPISQTDCSIRLRLRWLRKAMFDQERDHRVGRLESVRGSYAKVVCIDMDPRMVSRERLTQSGKSLRMVHFETREYIEDGYEFDITAAKKEDIPDFGLLKVRYILSIAMSLTGEGLVEDDQQ
ncbi:Integral membrane protein [Colletotrichum scovillei]|uniref:Integral membrane protein n=1 Tax=Colletotrichum scovillei TaxID=1209932 RepID=A0A9P7RAD2_9PEZI|nr:Integral membrane protein [Colletotrichum scovillei]KAG7072178.1 Integral membrane protein [Colletotrichum scovillei]KAG7080524.1 Integral membrane protein [Colletotrichum scovillei]